MSRIVLNGITWAHSRGITPLLAGAQRFSELYPHITIHWQKRSLQEFADAPLEQLARQYDLLIVDHPWVGCAAATGCVLPLNKYLPVDYLENQAQHSVGCSHESYRYNGNQWALAIDAATPAASYRADLLQKNNTALPDTWDELIELAKAGKVAVPAIPIDLLMNFYTFCIAHGKEPFTSREEVIDTATGLQALETMRQLYSLVNREMFGFNPIAVAERMSTTDEYWYCPFAYAYSNYARRGYAKYLLHYADLVQFNNQRLRSTIGGTGIAVSAHSLHPAAALLFAEYMVSETCQTTLYVEHGGQPGHGAAWTSEHANALCNGFFSKVLPALQRSYMRPRYNGYLHFQDHAGKPLQQYLAQGGSPIKVLDEMNRIYRHSLAYQLHQPIV